MVVPQMRNHMKQAINLRTLLVRQWSQNPISLRKILKVRIMLLIPVVCEINIIVTLVVAELFTSPTKTSLIMYIFCKKYSCSRKLSLFRVRTGPGKSLNLK